MQNKWAEQTLRLVTNQNYLDRLQAVYPQEEGRRELAPATLHSLQSVWEERNPTALLNQLLNLEKFPYKVLCSLFTERAQCNPKEPCNR